MEKDLNFIGDESKLKKDTLALAVIEQINSYFNEQKDENYFIYYNFPFYRGEITDELIQAHVLLVSKIYGVIFFRCLLSSEISQEEVTRLDDLDNHIHSKISRVSDLRKSRRELKLNVTPKFYVENLGKYCNEDFVSSQNLYRVIKENHKRDLSEIEFEILVSSIEGSYSLKTKKERVIKKQGVGPLTKGEVLNIIQAEHSVFDIEQKKAALNIIDSPQRIRGLAGSGKTIILAMKAALYHLQNPDSEILYTFYTKALFGHVRNLIEKYYREFSDNSQPDWSKIHILHGWGGKDLKGVYSEICDINNIDKIGFIEARSFNRKSPFEYIFQNLEEEVHLKLQYDLALIDEGQDFPPAFYRVIRKITRNSRIVWAYDDFQNIFDVKIQDEKETFGLDTDGIPYVDFSKNNNVLQDIVLHKCYRTPRILLLHAFSLGLGIYNDKVLQRLENNKHWEDLGFNVEQGDSSDNSSMVISRPLSNSPNKSNELLRDEVINLHIFNSVAEECQFVANSIENDIKNQNLRPDDISVIGIDGKHIELYFNMLQEMLESKSIEVFNHLKTSNNNKIYSYDNHVTLSTLNKAKGNESGMVYIVGTEYGFINKDYILDRNKIFTAITRSKGWVVMTGYPSLEQCKIEMDALNRNGFKLVFKQPSEDSTRRILWGINEQQTILNEINSSFEHLYKLGLTKEQVIEMIKNQGNRK